MKYRREIDGLRAIAVLPVIFFHAGFKAFEGGFIGVDVFFVISGYLITTIILSDMNKKKFSIVTFYERRARRILPALFFVMLCCLPFAWMWLLPIHLQGFSESLLAVSAFSSNILFWQESGYFDVAAELKPLLHTWSLAVEEQYYVLFPLFLMALWKLRKRWIFGSLVVVGAASLSAAQWGAYNDPSATFFLLHTRLWELAIGALIAFYFLYKREQAEFIKSRKKTSEVLGFLGLSLICYSIFTFDKNTPFPSAYALIPTIGTGLIVVFSTSNTVVGRFLSVKPMVGIGLISYSAYLWHQPLFVFARHRSLNELETPLLLALSALSIVLAYTSWRFVEEPFRDKKVVSRKSIFIFAVACTLFFATTGIAGHFKNNLKWVGMLNPLNKEIKVADYTRNNKKLRQAAWDILRQKTGNEKYTNTNNPDDNKLWFDLSSKKMKLLLVGNSHSKDLYNVMQNSVKANSNFDLARYGVKIRDLNPKHKMFSSPNYVNAQIVVIANRYNDSGDDEKNLKALIDKIIDDGKRAVIVKNIFEFPEYRNGDWTLFDKVVYESWLNNDDKPTSILSASDKVHYDFFRAGDMRKPALMANLEIEKIADEIPSVVVLDRMDYICQEERQRCFSADSKLNKFFYDYGHHTFEGAKFYGTRIDQVNWLSPLLF